MRNSLRAAGVYDTVNDPSIVWVHRGILTKTQKIEIPRRARFHVWSDYDRHGQLQIEETGWWIAVV